MLVFFFLFLPYIHSLASVWSVAEGHITPEVLLMGQQCQAETFHGFIPCSLQTKHCYWPGLLLVLHFVLLLVFAFNRQQDPSINLLANLVGTGSLQVWILVSGGVLVSRCTGSLIYSEFNHPSWYHLPCQLFRRKSASSWIHLCYHSTYDIHCNYCLPHLSTIEAHQAVDEGA